jgi:mono/diheme cytochrome c family protein
MARPADAADALVCDLEERGQQSCIVCHQGTRHQDLIAPLKPR